MWRRFTYWTASYGYPRMLTINYTAQPSSLPSTTENTLAGFSNAAITQVSEGLVTALTPTIPGSAPYPSVAQAARIACIDTANLEFSLYIVAPKLTAFAADAVTVLPGVLSAILTAALLDGVVSPMGNPINGIFSGALNGPAYPGYVNT